MSEVFYALVVLACPVGMGVMMWVMMRGRPSGTGQDEAASTRSELDELRAQVRQLRAAQDAGSPRDVARGHD